jgi:hypothetical protein
VSVVCCQVEVCCECCVLSGRGLCDELVNHPDKFYRLWRVVVCDLETSARRRLWPTGAVTPNKKKNCDGELNSFH